MAVLPPLHHDEGVRVLLLLADLQRLEAYVVRRGLLVLERLLKEGVTVRRIVPTADHEYVKALLFPELGLSNAVFVEVVLDLQVIIEIDNPILVSLRTRSATLIRQHYLLLRVLVWTMIFSGVLLQVFKSKRGRILRVVMAMFINRGVFD